MRPSFRLSLFSLALAVLASGQAFAAPQHKFKVFVPGMPASANSPSTPPAEVSYNVNLLEHSFPQGEVGQSYSVSLASLLQISPAPTAPGYLEQVSWSLVGSLPAGLELAGEPGEPAISGTPSTPTAGAQFDVVATYSGKNGQRTYTIVVGDTTLDVTSISAGHFHTCAITTAGGAKCWGRGEYGQLGHGATSDAATPVDVVGLTTGVASVSAGYYHTCAVTTSGAAKCWGYGLDGQLGNGVTSNAVSPVNVSGIGSAVASIKPAANHTCAVTTSGGVKCWGYGGGGRLGNGSTANSITPVNVSGLASGVTDLSSGAYTTCAVSMGGVKCWGFGTYGALGNGSIGNASTPVNVSGLASGVASISVGTYTTCAVTTSGGAKCWGSGTDGALGNGGLATATTPVDVSGLTSGVANISAGDRHTCAVTTAGGAKCWGYGGEGRLGNGGTGNSATPVEVAGLTSGATGVSAGGEHTCAVTTNGGAKCWGYGANGQLGSGSTVNSATPANVSPGS